MAGPGGFTLVELLLVVSIVAVLAGALFKRVLFYQEMAEKAAMQQVEGALKSALILQYGHRMTLGMGSEINNITNENPIEWLAQKPSNYLGEFNSVNLATIEPGNWAYDKSLHELIYVPGRSEFFVPSKKSGKSIRFHTFFAYDFTPGYKGKSGKQLSGVIFAPVEPYQWLIREN